jgi:hypothetical protein
MRRHDRELSEIKELADIIGQADVCRIAMANNNTPYVVAMNFGFTGNPVDTLFFHCANEGKKLDMMRQNNYVCFEMDTDHEIYKGTKGCDWGSKFSSIIGYGNIHIVTDNNKKIEGLNSIMSHYGGEGEHTYDIKVVDNTTILRLEILEMTGKRK